MLKRRLATILSSALVLLMLFSSAGCRKDSSDNQNKGTGGPDTSSASTQTEGSGSSHPVTKDKITLKILTTEWTGAQVGNEMPIYQELEKKTNVHLEFELLPMTSTSQLEKFNLIMASGDLPDLVGYSNQDAILRYGTEGAFIPLQDLIKEYAPDIVKALDNPLVNDKLPYTMNNWGEITAGDGNIYTVPLFSSSNAIGPVFAIRVDWLEKLGLNMPETADDLYQVLKAFKDRDPNENGKPDEIPFVAGSGGGASTILPVINAFDAHMGLYIDKDGKVKFGPVEESFKESLAFLNKLYSEGLLEEDYLTSTRDQWLARCSNSQAGLMFVWPAGGMGAANSALQKVNSNFKFMPMAPLKSKSGARFKDISTAGRYLLYRNAITKANKYPVETMKYLNYCFSEEGTRLVTFGIEGTHYTMVDGKPVYTDKILKNPDGLDAEQARIREGINWSALPYQIGWDSHFQAFEKTAPWTIKAWELYREPGMVEAPFPTLHYTDDEFSRRNQLVTEIDTYKDAMIDKFIMGVEPLSKFDEFISKVNKAGLEELLKISNDAYDRYKKFGSK